MTGTLLALARAMLAYEKLDVYQCAVQFLALIVRLLKTVPPGNGAIAEQLRRAATSIPLNIAEGSGKTSPAERRRFCAIARGSAMECGASLDVIRLLCDVDDAAVRESKELLVRIVSMLTKMCR